MKSEGLLHHQLSECRLRIQVDKNVSSIAAALLCQMRNSSKNDNCVNKDELI